MAAAAAIISDPAVSIPWADGIAVQTANRAITDDPIANSQQKTSFYMVWWRKHDLFSLIRTPSLLLK
jgi:hypothetical protein